MKSKFLSVAQAADEYFEGDHGALTEVALMRGLMVFLAISSLDVRFAPFGLLKRPSDEAWPDIPVQPLTGIYPISWRLWPAMFTAGTVAVNRVWYRDPAKFPDGVRTFAEIPMNPETDRIAWFDKATILVDRQTGLVGRRALERVIAKHFESDRASELPATWPWGSYETALLRHLRAAAERFWKNYDPNEPDTAETKVEVVRWLVARGVKERTAEGIDTILRVENLPKGPRRKK